jgi:hypothetical protein
MHLSSINAKKVRKKMSNNIEKPIILSDGYFGLGEYIALSPKRQEDLLSMADMIRAYIKDETIKRPLNILLEAKPGTGKSYLVKELTKLVGKTLSGKVVEFLNYNLTNMESPRELYQCFRKIQNLHLSMSFPVVFFDEVDTKFSTDRYCYSTFLSPMYDGKIYEGGGYFNIGRAVFFFAASKSLLSIQAYSSENHNDDPQIKINQAHDKKISYPQWLKKRLNEMKSIIEFLNEGIKKESDKIPDKLLDFLDRMDRIVFIPPMAVMPESSEESSVSEKNAFLELQLIAASMIFNRFPGKIKYIENYVIAVLQKALLSSKSRRKPDSFVANSYPPIDGVFRIENLPPHCLDELDEYFEIIHNKKHYQNNLIPVRKKRYEDV